MADEPVTTTDKPLATLSETERKLDDKPVVAAREEARTPATERLRAFEDAELGEDAVRINGMIERGYGSRFKELPEGKQRKHAALEKLVVAEQKLADAHTALMQADADHEAAEAAVDAADVEDAGV